MKPSWFIQTPTVREPWMRTSTQQRRQFADNQVVNTPPREAISDSREEGGGGEGTWEKFPHGGKASARTQFSAPVHAKATGNLEFILENGEPSYIGTILRPT